MAKSFSNHKEHIHREGHVMGERNKRTSIGDGNRKRGSFNGRKKYKGQGRR